MSTPTSTPNPNLATDANSSYSLFNKKRGTSSTYSSKRTGGVSERYKRFVYVAWIAAWTQTTITVILYWWINSESSDWIDWQIPSQTLLFPAHFLLSIHDSVNWVMHDVGNLFMKTREFHIYKTILRGVLLVDLTAVIRQSILYEDTRNRWHLTQLVLLCILLTITLVRGCFVTRCVEDVDTEAVEGSAK